jgi:putative N6-adenine-specific DNA methylase
MNATEIEQSRAALERRIKRRLIGQVQTFFAVTAPGLESLCRRELQALPEALTITGLEKGGVAFSGRLHELYAANLHCRTAHRILMRIGDFRSETFDALVQKTLGIPWELYLPAGCDLDFKVSTHRSRLYHSDAVAERLQQGIQARMALHPPIAAETTAPPHRQCIYARLIRNRCQLSIDSSGANLHKRGIRTSGGKAPLRETLAAAVLLRAGYTGREILCDPMCGSGTFAVEAALMAKKIPPGWHRAFAFEAWPAFRAGRWRHIRRIAEPPETAWRGPAIHASDRQGATLATLRQILTSHGLNDIVRVDRCDFESLAGSQLSPTGGIVVLNPPYGRRLGSRKSAAHAYDRIGRHLKTRFKGWKAAVLAPSRHLCDVLKLKARHCAMQHGGQRVHLLVGKIPS